MLYYILFWMFNGLYYIVLYYFWDYPINRRPSPNCCFFAYFSVSQKRNIKRSPNGMKPSGELFLEQTQSRRLGVEVKEATRRPRGRAAHPRAGAPPTLVGPSWLHRPTSFAYIYSYTPKTSRSTMKPYFHRRNSLYPWDPILGPFPALCWRGNRSRRASTSTP